MSNTYSNNIDMHEGKVIQRLIKESPQTLTGIAMQMGKSRNMLYSRFKLKRLTPSFLFSLGKIINIDLKRIFPRLSEDQHYLSLVDEKEMLEQKQGDEIYKKLQEKYYRLLEGYNKLFKFLFRVIKQNGLKPIEKELKTFLNNDPDL